MRFKRVVSMLPIFERSRAAILLSILVFLAAPAWGAVAFVQKVPTTTTATHYSGTSPQTIAITPTAGNLLVVVVTVGGSTSPTNTVTVSDSDSVSYTPSGNATTSGGLGRVSIFYRPNVTSGAKTITITPSATPASPEWAVEVMEYFGVNTTPTVTTNSATGSSTTPTVSVTPTAGASLYIAATGTGNASPTSYTSGAGWTQRYSDPSNSPNPPNASEEITSATGAQTATWTQGSLTSWVAVIAAFSTPSSGGIAWIQNVNSSVGSSCVAGYSYVRTVTIDHTQVPNTDQSNFPVLFSGTYSYLATVANGGKVTNASGFDIIFTDNSGAKLDHEIESYSATTGAVNFWVRVPTVSFTTDTVISLCYGNAAISTSQENKTGVWDTNFKGVWHMKENPAGAAPQMKDSTATANNGTSNGGMTSVNQVAGQINGSINFDGVNDYIQAPDYDITGAITISAWIKWNVASLYDGIVSKRTPNEVLGDWNFRMDETTVGLLEWEVWTAVDTRQNVTSVSAISTGAWNHVVLTFDDPTNTTKFYINGVLDKTDTSMTNSLANTPEPIRIGWTGQGPQYFNGIIDEVRTSNSVRSADWVKTEYNNQNSPSTFYTLGAESAGNGATSITSPALPQEILAGDLIVVSVRAPTGTITVNDNQNPTGYTLATGPTNNHSIYYFPNSMAVPANTLTVTATTTGTAGTMRIFVDVFRGAATSNVLDTTSTVTAKNAATSCTVIPDSSPSAGNGELVYLTAGMTTQSTYTACTTNGAAMTIGGQNNTAGNGSMFTSYALSSLAGAQNAAIQAGTACVGCLNGGVAIFRPVCTYNFRKTITANTGQVSSGPHTNFPLLVSFTDANLKTTANGGNVTDASGNDIIFRASDGITQLDHEIEKYTATTGELVAWVRVPSLDVGTVIYMYYGNSCVTLPTQNPTGVWDANFKGVWHLKEATNTTRLDSTSNYNGLADTTNTAAATGKINGAADFVPTDYLTSGGALAVDAAASTSAVSASSLSWSHTASGSNRLVIVGVSRKQGGVTPPAPITSVTYGGTAMTLIGSKSHFDQEIAMYQLINPPTGAQTVTVTLSAVVNWFIGGSVSFTGAHQTTPTGTFALAEGINGSPSVNVTSAAGEIVIDTVNFDSQATTLTVGAGQAQQWKINRTGWGAESTEAGAASVTMSWTPSPTNDNWVIGAVSVKPAIGSTGLNLGTQFTLEAWVKGDEVTSNKVILGKESTSNASYKLRFSSDRFTVMTSFDGTTANNLNQSGSSVAATWYHVVGVYNSPNMYLYINGVLNNSLATAGGSVFGGTAPFNIGSQNNGTQPFDGIIDEGRVSNVARSAGWILTEYNNMTAPGTFSAVGTQEGPGALNAYETGTYKGAITGFINTKIAGATASLDIIALTTTTPKTIDTSTTWSAIQVKVEVIQPTSTSVDSNNCPTTYNSLNSANLTFPTCTAGNCGRATFNLTMPANSYPNARLRISYPTSSPTSIGCSTDNFAIRPGTFSLAVTDTDWQTTGTPGARALDLLTFAATTPIHKAGRPFSVRATAQASAGAATTNYAGAPTPTLKSCVGAACTASFGTLTLGTSFASGALAADAATYNNVGSFALQLIDQSFSSVDAVAGDTPANCSGQYVCGVTLNVGRFVPDHFAVSYNTPVFGTTCGSFTYVGQPFNYTTAPVITVTAQEFIANNTTNLYNTTGSWWRITNASLTGKAYSAAVGTLDSSGITGTDPVIASSGLGVGTLTFSSGTGLLFTRTTPVAPFNADVSLAINVIDADGVTYASNPARFSAATAGNGIAFSGGKPMRFGQLALGNALGSELLNLPIPIQTQYWNGTSFVTNTLDSCTTIIPSNIVLSNYQPGLTSGNLPSGNISISGAFNAGIGNLKLTKPLSAVNGSVDLCVDLGADATCVATSAGMSYLQGVWSGTTYTIDPRSRAAFGFGKGSYSGGGRDPFVYQRENY